MVTPGQLARRAAFFEQLAAMISAGVTLPKALEMAGRNRSIGVSPQVVQALLQHLQNGHTFTDSLLMVSGQKASPDGQGNGNRNYWLAEFDVALLSTGEETGRLDDAFRTLARYYAARAKIIRDTIAGLLMTAATLHVFLIVFPLNFLVAMVVGLFNNDNSAVLPFLIEKGIVFGLLYGTLLFFAFACSGNRGEAWRAMVEDVLDLVPGLRMALRHLALARLSCTLAALNNAGVGVVRSWNLAGAACGSPRLKRALAQEMPKIEQGLTPGQILSGISYFPEMFCNLYNSAEISGKLDETLNRLYTYYEDDGFRRLQFFTRILNGGIYMLVVLLVGYNVIQFYVGRFASMGNMLNGF